MNRPVGRRMNRPVGATPCVAYEPASRRRSQGPDPFRSIPGGVLEEFVPCPRRSSGADA